MGVQMTVIPTGLYNKYYEMADLFITEINKGLITLYYNPTNLTSNVVNLGEQPRNVTMYGGRGPLSSMPGRFLESGNNVNQTPTTEDINCRIYWTAQKFNIINSIADNKNTCKIICYSKDAFKMVNAAYATVETAGRTAKISLVKNPTQYGIGPTKRYAESFWEEIES